MQALARATFRYSAQGSNRKSRHCFLFQATRYRLHPGRGNHPVTPLNFITPGIT